MMMPQRTKKKVRLDEDADEDRKIQRTKKKTKAMENFKKTLIWGKIDVVKVELDQKTIIRVGIQSWIQPVQLLKCKKNKNPDFRVYKL
jgi:hypothetical protein